MHLDEFLQRKDVPADLKEAIVREITDRNHLVKALFAAEDKLRCLLDQELVGVYIILENRFVFVNRTFAALFGYEPDEMLTMSPLDVVIEEDRAIVAANIKKRIDGDIKTLRYSIRGKRKDGKLIFIEVQGTRADFRRRPAIIGIAVDITRRKRYEAIVGSIGKGL